ncbi:hypothetical protein CLAFUW4_05165 [Fulvia fulva]|nr:hypothetical protein CLAFUR4_05151 [Fulvia fulva]WPV14167.1 hypothetical protein CLAFUW4_05165 [Fulvia fulva]
MASRAGRDGYQLTPTTPTMRYCRVNRAFNTMISTSLPIRQVISAEPMAAKDLPVYVVDQDEESIEILGGDSGNDPCSYLTSDLRNKALEFVKQEH